MEYAQLSGLRHQPLTSHPTCSRRDFVRVGALTALGMGLSDLLRIRTISAAGPLPARAKSCILIWLDGGPSHLETFDPKPKAPVEIRGPMGTIPSAISGVHLSDLMPNTAKRLKRVALIRSVTSPLGEHNFGTHYLQTGYRPTPALNYPAIGSVVCHQRGDRTELPAYVAIPNLRVGGGKFVSEGYLSAAVAPFEAGGDPGRPDFRVRNLDPFPGITSARLDRRREYVRRLDARARQIEQATDIAEDAAFEQAYRLMASSSARDAFDLSKESAAVRDQYGRRSVGQSCLLARRLVERGVPFVTVNNTGWDTHNDLYTRLKEGYTGARIPVGLVPSLDQALGALIDDLSDRGLFDETLIVVMGEFGRTPKLNPAGGRDHWPRVFSVLFAGGGVPGGQVIGSSDTMGESPRDRPLTPSDLAATWYTLMGIDPQLKLMTSDGRPVPLVQNGQPLPEIVG